MSDTPGAPQGATGAEGAKTPAFIAVDTSAPAVDPYSGQDGADDTFDLSSVLAKYEGDQPVQEAGEPAAPSAEPPPAAAAPAPAAQAPADLVPGRSPLVQAAAQLTGQQPPAEQPKAEDPVELQARTLAILTRKQAEFDQARAQLDQRVADARTAAIEEVKRLFVQNPRAFVRTVGLKPDQLGQVGTLFLGESLGDDAPDDVKQKLQMYELQSQLDAIKQDKETQREQEGSKLPPHVIARAQAVEAEIEAFVEDVPAELRFLAHEAKDNPREALEALCQIAIPLANKAYREGGRWPTAREVARQLNDQLARDYERLSRAAGQAPAVPPARTTQAPTPSTQAPPTLSDADLTARPDRKPEGLLTDEEYVTRALSRFGKDFVR